MRRIIVSVLTLFVLSCAMAFGQSQIQGKGTGTFDNVRLLMPMGDGFKATDVTVRFEADRFVVRSTKDPEDVKTFRYSDIRSAEYTFSRGPRYQANTAMIVTANVLSFPLFLKKVDRHRLEVQSDKDSALLDLNKDNYKALLITFQAASGRKVAADGTLSPAQGLASISSR